MTATVGAMWDSMLAEGKPWWITTTSDGHQGCGGWVKNPVDPLNQTAYDNLPYDAAGHTYNTTGRFPDPVDAGRPVIEYSSFPPGRYNKTWVGATARGYRAVMQAMRAGRMWVCFGDLIGGLDVRLRPHGASQPGVPMGGTLKVRGGDTVEVVVKIDLAGPALDIAGQVNPWEDLWFYSNPIFATVNR